MGLHRALWNFDVVISIEEILISQEERNVGPKQKVGCSRLKWRPLEALPSKLLR